MAFPPKLDCHTRFQGHQPYGRTHLKKVARFCTTGRLAGNEDLNNTTFMAEFCDCALILCANYGNHYAGLSRTLFGEMVFLGEF